MGCVYEIKSPSGRIYIGKTMDFHRRKYNYSRLICKSQKKLYNSFVKYGFEAHVFTILFESEIETDLFDMEILLIKKLDTMKYGLNMTLGGEGFSGGQHTEETLQKVKLSRAWYKNTPEHNKKIALSLKGNKRCLGRKLTPEHKGKISGKGRVLGPMPQIYKDKISSSKMGSIPWNKGVALVSTHREKVLAFNTSACAINSFNSKSPQLS